MNTMSTGAASRPALSRGAVRGHVAILALFLVAIMSQLSPQASADENKSVKRFQPVSDTSGRQQH